MIVDADVHLSRTEPLGMDGEELLRTMDRAGVERALIWLQPPYMRHIGEANRAVYEAARRHPDRFLPFGWADLRLGLEQAEADMRRCVEEYGMLGVKFNGAQNEYFVDRVELFPLYAWLAEARRAIAFHVGADAYEYTHPYRVAKVARRFPGMPVLVAHMGGAGAPDLSAATIEFAGECPNMLLIGSNVGYPKVRRAIETLGAARVCFGSDTPFQYMHVERAAYEALLADLPREQREAVMGGNILAALTGQR